MPAADPTHLGKPEVAERDEEMTHENAVLYLLEPYLDLSWDNDKLGPPPAPRRLPSNVVPFRFHIYIYVYIYISLSLSLSLSLTKSCAKSKRSYIGRFR